MKESLEAISGILEDSLKRRESIISASRKIVLLCSQAIVAVHKNDYKLAKSKAKKALSSLYSQRRSAPVDLRLHMATAEQEVVEALSLIAVAEGRPIPEAKEIDVTHAAYIYGLLDCVGELRRMTIEMIRAGRLNEAQRIFDVMEELYQSLYPFAMYERILKDVRRKTDVNRVLVENTRSVLIEEIRRTELINAMRKVNGAGDGI